MFLKLDTFYTFCCSIQLSYVRILVRTAGFEPTTHRPLLQVLNFVAVSVEAK